MSLQTTADLAALFGCSRRKVRELARQLGVGYDIGGPAGFRFTPADVEHIRAAMSIKPPEAPRRTA